MEYEIRALELRLDCLLCCKQVGATLVQVEAIKLKLKQLKGFNYGSGIKN